MIFKFQKEEMRFFTCSIPTDLECPGFPANPLFFFPRTSCFTLLTFRSNGLSILISFFSF